MLDYLGVLPLRRSKESRAQQEKLSELKRKQEEVRRQKLREKLEAKQQRAKDGPEPVLLRSPISPWL
eukprot:g17749.t1